MASVPFCNLEDTFNMTDWEKKQNSQLLNTFRNSNTCVSRNNSFQNQVVKNQFGLPANPLNVGQNLDLIKKEPKESKEQQTQQVQNSQPIQQVQQIQNAQMQQEQTQQAQQMYQYVPVMPYYTCPERIPLYYQQYQQWPQQLALPSRWGIPGPQIMNGMNGMNRTVESFDNIGPYGTHGGLREHFSNDKGHEIMRYVLLTILIIYGIYLLFDIVKE